MKVRCRLQIARLRRVVCKPSVWPMSLENVGRFFLFHRRKTSPPITLGEVV
jgi:hypothetical protein